MKISFKQIIEAVIVSKCPSCGRVVRYFGTICPECLEEYTEEKNAGCTVCGLPAGECTCSTRNLPLSKSFGKNLYSIMFYNTDHEVFNSLLFNLKRDMDRGSEKFFARELSAEILRLMSEKGLFCRDWCITYPPRTQDARLNYGFDQAEGLCRRISKYTGLQFEKNVLVNKSKKRQKNVKNLKGRAENAKDSFSLSKKADVKGKRYIIVDDVITSGSTVGACQELLLSAGAKEVFPVSVARTTQRALNPENTRSKPSPTAWFNK